ncbi:PREDICTED: uncharacterized protein LOC108609780 isoform X1 [Drosophila arizonae]|uniref:Uncharacterized protein LOC108609780 isoform X1 n=2 Tax=Drosophila arizonae TaxID=7263 RepID=A0ABM1NPX9_DROAR|nr:PREDICTED: uncharacterized protein LOC108609780 isoform X1 [Drosophila arizonae]
MITTAINYSLVVLLGCIVVVTVRITLPSILDYDEPSLFQQMKFNVIKVYISLTAIIVLEVLLIYLSVSAMYMVSEWLSVLYVPLLIYAMHRTYALCVVQLQPLISGDDANLLLLQYYQDYFENDDPKWLDLQAKMGCCGLSGPQTYLDYLRRVPAVCYRQGILVTRGCEYVVYDAFQGVHQLSKLLIWLALGIELVTLLLYMRLIIRKYRYLICRRIVAYNDFKRY